MYFGVFFHESDDEPQQRLPLLAFHDVKLAFEYLINRLPVIVFEYRFQEAVILVDTVEYLIC